MSVCGELVSASKVVSRMRHQVCAGWGGVRSALDEIYYFAIGRFCAHEWIFFFFGIYNNVQEYSTIVSQCQMD